MAQARGPTQQLIDRIEQQQSDTNQGVVQTDAAETFRDDVHYCSHRNKTDFDTVLTHDLCNTGWFP